MSAKTSTKKAWLLQRGARGSNWFQVVFYLLRFPLRPAHTFLYIQIAQVVVPLSAVVGGVFFTFMGIKSHNKHQWKVIQEGKRTHASFEIYSSLCIFLTCPSNSLISRSTEADNKLWLDNIKRERREKMLRLQQADRTKSAECPCPEH
jgi:hypothetical protein